MRSDIRFSVRLEIRWLRATHQDSLRSRFALRERGSVWSSDQISALLIGLELIGQLCGEVLVKGEKNKCPACRDEGSVVGPLLAASALPLRCAAVLC
jgi:hypothetical protein